LIPAYDYANAPISGIKGTKAQIPRRKIKFFGNYSEPLGMSFLE
jgi:hypothetical protein